MTLNNLKSYIDNLLVMELSPKDQQNIFIQVIKDHDIKNEDKPILIELLLND